MADDLQTKPETEVGAGSVTSPLQTDVPEEEEEEEPIVYTKTIYKNISDSDSEDDVVVNANFLQTRVNFLQIHVNFLQIRV